ncbi:MAG: hypothetical protein GXO75_15425 [Calditrichaeota bacterium]|nr:hypothetical protein [Calditrichota bacterium]
MGFGAKTKFAFKIESSFGTPVTVGSGDLVSAKSGSIAPQEDVGRQQRDFGGRKMPVTKKVGGFGSVELELHYGAVLQILASALGQSHNANSPYNTGTVYRHYLEPVLGKLAGDWSAFDDSSSSSRCTTGILAVDRDGVISQLEGAYPTSFELRFLNGICSGTVQVEAKKYEHKPSENTSSSSWTLPSGDAVVFADAQIFIKLKDEFVVTASNNVVVVNEGSAAVNITLTEDTYSGETLADHIEAQLNASSSLSNNYWVEYRPGQRKFFIYSSASFRVEGANTSMTADDLLGFRQTTGYANFHASDYLAKPSTISDFGSGDALVAASATVQFSRTVVAKTDASSGKRIPVPHVTDFNCSGVITLHHHEDLDIIEKAGYFSTYEMKIVATSGDYKMNIYLPQVFFNKPTAGVPGPAQIRPTLPFVAVDPAIVNVSAFVNLDANNYFLKPMPDFPSATDEACYAFASMGRKLYATSLSSASATIYLYRLDYNSWSVETSWANDISRAMTSWKGSIYIGCKNGKIKQWDGSTLTDVYTYSTVEWVDFEVFDDKLWAISNTGVIAYTSDGTTWTNSYTGGTAGWMLKVYDGELYAVVTATTGKVLAYNSGTWSTSYDFGASYSWMSLEIFNRRLYAVGDSNLREYDGSSWSSLTAFTTTMRYIKAFGGYLFAFPDGASQDIYVYDVANQSQAALTSSFGKTINRQPFVFEGKLLVSTTDIKPYFYENPRRLFITLENDVSSNPLS